MSPASYLTAPPREPMLAAAPEPRQSKQARELRRRAGARARRRAPGLRRQLARLLDELLGQVDLALVQSEVAIAKRRLGSLEVLQCLSQQLGDLAARRGRPSTWGRRHLLAERR